MRFPGIKLPSPRPEPLGIEASILKSVLRWCFWGSLFIVEPSIFARLFDWNPKSVNIEVAMISIDIGVVAVLILYWTFLFTITISALIVKVIKGHAYQADAYPLIDAERPRS